MPSHLPLKELHMLRAIDRYRGVQAFADFPCDHGFLALAMNDQAVVAYESDSPSLRVVLLIAESSPVSFVRGDPAAANAIADKVLRQAGRSSRPIEILSTDPNWGPEFQGCEAKKAWRIPRLDYCLGCDSMQRVRPTVDPAFDVVPLEGELVDRVREQCDPDFSPDYFVNHRGMGFAALDRDRIVSVAWTPVANGWTNIAIATTDSYCKRGLASAVGAALIEKCLRDGLRVHVTTDERNVAARSWAKRVGLVASVRHDWVVLRRHIEPGR
jgi:hypothetical protein